jgi:predicted oxidoreductase
MTRVARKRVPAEDLAPLLARAVERGIYTIDLADIYGDYTGEQQFAAAWALTGLRREQITLVTKCGICIPSDQFPAYSVKHYNSSVDHIQASVERSLRMLRTDYLDVLLLHRPDFLMHPAEVAQCFARLHQSGKVLHFGVSNFSPSQVEMLQAFCERPLVVHQLQVSAMHRNALTDGCLDQCLRLGIRPMAWSPLGGGHMLTQEVRLASALALIATELGAQSPEQVLLAWLLAHPSAIVPIVGTGQILHLDQAADALDIQLSRQHWYQVLQAACGQAVA